MNISTSLDAHEFIRGQLISISFSFDIINTDSRLNISRALGNGTNYDVIAQLSDVDMAVQNDTLGLEQWPITMTIEEEQVLNTFCE